MGIYSDELTPQIYYLKGVKKRPKLFKYIFRFFKILFLLCFIAGIVIAVLFWRKYGETIKTYYTEAKQTVQEGEESDFKGGRPSKIYASDGSELIELVSDKGIDYILYDEMPAGLLEAFIAIEDKRFYAHHGVDWLSTAKAAYLLFVNDGEVTRGGSTITQQLARNIYLNFETSYERKIREIFIALELEKKYSKSEILEFYINNINYGNGYYGIGAAADGYFGKDVSDLTLEEIAFLCAIPNNPTYYNPREHLDHTVERRNLILKEMYSQEYLSYEEYLSSVNKAPIVLDEVAEFYNYESSYAIDCAVRFLMEKCGFVRRYSFESETDFKEYQKSYRESYSDCKAMLYTNGYRIYTSLDKDVQKVFQKCVDDELCDLTETVNDVFLYQGAGTVIDNQSGLVVAVVGGRSQDTSGVMTLNRAYQSYKQPGSTIKPLIVYTPLLEGDYTADSIVEDVPIEGGPKNSGGSYLGSITFRTAVEKSKNVVAWRLFEKLTPQVGLSYLQKMQFSKIVPNDYFLPASLGGLTYGVNTVEMASAYSTLANDGVYREPTCITSILNVDGVEIFKKAETQTIYDVNAAREMTDILRGVATRGTAAGLSWDSEMPIACKTGTTNEQMVGWFCGYTPYYSVAVYVGADSNKTLDGLWGSSYPCDIWCSIQKYLNEGKSVVQFRTAEPKESNPPTEQAETNTTTSTVSTPTGEQSSAEAVVAPVTEPVVTPPVEVPVTPPPVETPVTPPPPSGVPEEQPEEPEEPTVEFVEQVIPETDETPVEEGEQLGGSVEPINEE